MLSKNGAAKPIVKLLSWSVDGVSQLMRNISIQKFLETHRPTVLCLQDTRIFGDFRVTLPGFEDFSSKMSINAQHHTGGVSIFVDKNALSAVNSFNYNYRLQCVDFGSFVLINTILPNGYFSRAGYQSKVSQQQEMKDIIASFRSKGKEVLVVGQLGILSSVDPYHWESPIMSQINDLDNQWLDTLTNETQIIDVTKIFHPSSLLHTHEALIDETPRMVKSSYVLASKDFVSRNVVDCRILNRQTGSTHFPILCQFNP